MKPRDVAELLLLGALWGGSFLFMRVAAPEFGPLALVWVRVGVAALVLLPLLAWRGQMAALRAHWKPIAVVGVLNSALPFLFFNIAALVLSAGLMAIFNATAPMWALLVAWGWLRQRPPAARMAGVALGFLGVVGLAWGNADLPPGDLGVSPALGIGLCVGASLMYGIAVNFTRRHLGSVAPLVVATGSQAAATVVLTLPALATWPAHWPSGGAWAAAFTLAMACTGLAYILYFRLIARAGATSAMSVTLLIPAFALLWGTLFLGEVPSEGMWAGCAAILLGTALSTGLLAPRVARLA
jgi:drug/metabolite transporter (DMT)-like permease